MDHLQAVQDEAGSGEGTLAATTGLRVEFQAENTWRRYRFPSRSLTHELRSPYFASSYLGLDAVRGHFYLGDSAKGE
jgi:hypothetical protein